MMKKSEKTPDVNNKHPGKQEKKHTNPKLNTNKISEFLNLV